jgi:hypothetical protein
MSFMCGKIADAGAFIFAVRETRNAAGCRAATIRNNTTTAATPMRMLNSMERLRIKKAYGMVVSVM